MNSILDQHLNIEIVITDNLMSKKTDNYLLKKTELGQVKKGFHELPNEAHTYGKAPQKDKEGAR